MQPKTTLGLLAAMAHHWLTYGLLGHSDLSCKLYCWAKYFIHEHLVFLPKCRKNTFLTTERLLTAYQLNPFDHCTYLVSPPALCHVHILWASHLVIETHVAYKFKRWLMVVVVMAAMIVQLTESIWQWSNPSHFISICLDGGCVLLNQKHYWSLNIHSIPLLH